VRLFEVGVFIALVCAACEDRPLIDRVGQDGGIADGRRDLVVVPDGRDDVMDAADALDTTDGQPACSGRFAADPGNPYNPTRLPECVDGADNDGDGFVDYADPDCTAFSDNDESSFAVRTATDEEDFLCDRDCYFDSNAASGDDGCIGPLPRELPAQDTQRLRLFRLLRAGSRWHLHHRAAFNPV
jgi:hypothetical protein